METDKLKKEIPIQPHNWQWHESLFSFLALIVILFVTYRCGVYEGRDEMVADLARAMRHDNRIIEEKNLSVSPVKTFKTKVPSGWRPTDEEFGRDK